MIYICGDSFATPDPGYGPMWAELIEQKLGRPVKNLARVCASNLVISQQVNSIESADFVIVLFSASTRGTVRFDNKILPFSWVSLDESLALDTERLQLLQLWQEVFFDLDLAIYENQCIIESTLQRLVDKNIPFRFDQGGFEHPSYGGVGTYFTKYNAWRSDLCLWDLGNTSMKKPHYHINDPVQHERIADYYCRIINENT